MGICFSVYERAGEQGEVVYNTAVLLGQDGELIGTYRKVHLALRRGAQRRRRRAHGRSPSTTSTASPVGHGCI